MKAPEEKPKVRLIGEDGNAFAILGKVTRSLRKAKADEEYIKKYQKEAMSGHRKEKKKMTITGDGLKCKSGWTLKELLNVTLQLDPTREEGGCFYQEVQQ